jgi:hypothetical protein
VVWVVGSVGRLLRDARAEGGEEFSSQIVRAVGVVPTLAAHVVVHDAAVFGTVDMGLREVHAEALYGLGDSTDEHHRAVCLNPFDHSHMGEGIVDQPIPVVIPGIVEKDEIAWPHHGALMNPPVLPHMGVDEPDAIGLVIPGVALIEIDAMRQVDGPCDARAVIRDAPTLDFNRACADQFCRRARNRLLACRRMASRTTVPG